MASNFVEVVTEAVKSVGVEGADWRVQAGAVAILIVSGVGMMRLEQIRGHIRGWRTKRKERNENTETEE